MKTLRRFRLSHALGALALLAAASPAWAVRTTLDNTVSGYAGQTVLVNLTTTSLTGLNVRSFQFDVTYNASVVTATAVVDSGSIAGTAGWGDATFSVTPGHLFVSHAGSNALTGSGTLLQIRFVINPSLINGSGTGLNFGSFLFNEGTPADTTVNGYINVLPIPVITVSPNTGEIIRGQTLQFNVSGSVTTPVTWGTTDASIATIVSNGTLTGLMTGVAPGSVRVFAVDAASRRDTTDQTVQVRGMGVTAGNAAVTVGQSFVIPVTVTSLNGLGVRSGQFTFSFNGSLFSVTGVNVPNTALLYNYGPVSFSSSTGACTVAFAGTTSLTGSGELFELQCLASSASSGATGINFGTALFNEDLIAKPTSGVVSVNALPAITVSPEAVTLFDGQTQNFTVSGPAVPPITWSTLDSTVATINATGKLTAVGGGVTRVKAMDSVGNFDLNTSVTVYDCKLTVNGATGPPGGTVRVELQSDRDLSPLGIYSAQYTLLANPTNVTQMKADPGGLIGGWSPGNLAYGNPGGASLNVAAAGATPLGSGTALQVVDVTISPSATLGTVIPLTLSNLIFNEGRPVAQIVNGSITVQSNSGIVAGNELAFALDPPEPNPTRGSTVLRFALPRGGPEGARMVLAVHGLDGRRVRTLVDGVWPAGIHEVRWDGRGDAGSETPPGMYFLRLDWAGQRLTRRLVRVR
ncbi:MAG TPA: cohesin domain-containing protein [Candidatus Sulfotelmatobacter sp.]|nr:cohesin domain-containing protein [Candidatus Sulfotelmatobacter sp.]